MSKTTVASGSFRKSGRFDPLDLTDFLDHHLRQTHSSVHQKRRLAVVDDN